MNLNVLMLLFKDIHYDARVQREAIALAEEGHKVTIACLEEYAEEPPVLHENIYLLRCSITTKRMRRTIETVPERTSKLSRFIIKTVRLPIIKLVKDVLANHEYYTQVKKWMKHHTFNVIHCHDLNTLPAGYYLAKRFNAVLVYDSHELYNEMAGKNNIERRVGYWVERRLIRSVNHLIVVNPYVKDLFHKRYGHLPTTIVQNTPSLPNLDKAPPQKVTDLRRKYRLSDDDILLLFQGGLTPERGLEECIEAVKLLPERYKLILIGEGRLEPALRQKVANLQLGNRVFFHGAVPPQVILWYTKQGDIGLVMYKNTCANNYYSTPNKVFEYIMAGIPTVASDHPGKRYIVEKEQTGVCVEETPEGIKKGIEMVMANYHQFQQQCLTKRHKLSWQNEKQNIVKLYQRLERQIYEKDTGYKPTLSS